MRKHNQIHTLCALHYKVHFRFLRKLKDCKCALWYEKCGSYPDLFTGNHLLTTHKKTCERMLRHGAVYGDNCRVVWVLRTTWCSWKAARRKEEYREFALINHRQSSNLGFWNLANCKIHWSISSLKRKWGFMLKSDIKSCPFATDPFIPGLMRHCSHLRWYKCVHVWKNTWSLPQLWPDMGGNRQS